MLLSVQVAVLRDQSRSTPAPRTATESGPGLGGMVNGGFHVIAGASETLEHIGVRKISLSDLTDALRRGLDDFIVKPSHVVFSGLIYPLVGVILAAWTSGSNNALPLLFPLMSGFALLGPFAAIGLYEISRRRELGLDTSWRHALKVRHSAGAAGNRRGRNPAPRALRRMADHCAAAFSQSLYRRRRAGIAYRLRGTC